MGQSKGGGSKEGVEFEKTEDASVEDLINKIPRKYKKIFKCDQFRDQLHDLLEKSNIKHEIVKVKLVPIFILIKQDK